MYNVMPLAGIFVRNSPWLFLPEPFRTPGLFVYVNELSQPLRQMTMEDQYAEARRMDAGDVRQCVAGSRAAFDRLHGRYRNLVFAIADHVLEDLHLAEDCVQQVFVIVWKQLKNLRQPEMFGPWLRKIARREIVRTARGRRRVREVPFDESFQLGPPFQGALMPDRATEAHVERVNRAIEELSDDSCALVHLFYIRSLSIAQIAHFLGVPEGTVKRRLHDTRRKLGTTVKVEGGILDNRASVHRMLTALEHAVHTRTTEDTMKIAVLSDIHGNLEALRAVLKDVRKQAVERIIVTGDIVGAVGQPRDKDPRAGYCVYDTVTREVTMRRVPYDVETAAEKVVAAGLPEVHAERLLKGA